MKEYFSHDFHSRLDSKIVNMRIDWGAEGYGIYWMLVELLHEEPSHTLTCERNALAMRTQCDGDRVVQYVQDCISKYDLFIYDKESNSFTSHSVLERAKVREEKSTKARKSAESRWKDGNANAMRTQCDTASERNAIKVKESKEKKRKDLRVCVGTSESHTRAREEKPTHTPEIFSEKPKNDDFQAENSEVITKITDEYFESLPENTSETRLEFLKNLTSSLLKPPKTLRICEQKNYTNGKKLPLSRHIWLTISEAVDVVDQALDAGIPLKNLNLLFKKVDRRARGSPRADVYLWLTGWAKVEVVKEISEALKLKREKTYHGKTR